MSKIFAKGAIVTALAASAVLATAFSAQAVSGQAERTLPAFADCNYNSQALRYVDFAGQATNEVSARTIKSSSNIGGDCGKVTIRETLYIVSNGAVVYQVSDTAGEQTLKWNLAPGQSAHLHSQYFRGSAKSPIYIAALDGDGNVSYAQA